MIAKTCGQCNGVRELTIEEEIKFFKKTKKISYRVCCECGNIGRAYQTKKSAINSWNNYKEEY